MIKKPIWISLIVLLSILVIPDPAACWVFERRTEQFKTDFSYAFFPVPYSIPGIGSGLGIAGGFMNIGGSPIDTYGMIIEGDVAGKAIGVADIHVIDHTLILDIGYSKIDKAAFGFNYSRGMEGDENPDDFNSIEITDSTYYGGMVTLTLMERLFEINLKYYKTQARVERVRDKDGDIIAEFDDPKAELSTIRSGSVIIDLTDDRHDPRNGFRLAYSRNFPTDEGDGVLYYTVDINSTLFIPLLTNSTFVLNRFQSDAVVLRQGETDRATIETKLGLLCPPGDTDCEETKRLLINQTLANNTYGTASSLGGTSRLRSFTSMRYRGAHTLFYGAEFRWNLTDENEKFNIFFMEDLRTSFQAAFFHEIGSIADKKEDLFKESRHSTGAGFRVIMGSGIVYRLDIANGEEGNEYSLFFGYPWDFL